MSVPHAGMDRTQAAALAAHIGRDPHYRVNLIVYGPHRYGLIVWIRPTAQRLEIADPAVWAAWQAEEVQA